MKSYRITTILIVLIITSLFNCFVSLSDVTKLDASSIESIIEYTEMGDSMVWSGKGNILFEWANLDSLSSRMPEIRKVNPDSLKLKGKMFILDKKVNINLVFNGPKIFVEENYYTPQPDGGQYFVNTLRSSNGETMYYLRKNYYSENSPPKKEGTISHVTEKKFKEYDPRHYSMLIHDTPIAEFLRGTTYNTSFSNSTAFANITLLGEEELGGVLCIVLKGKVLDSDETITVWLAPCMIYRPVRIEFRYSNFITIVNNTFKQYQDNVWFPIRIERLHYCIEDGFEEPLIITRLSLTLHDDFEVNTEIPDSTFIIDFPEGTEWVDLRIGQETKKVTVDVRNE